MQNNNQNNAQQMGQNNNQNVNMQQAGMNNNPYLNNQFNIPNQGLQNSNPYVNQTNQNSMNTNLGFNNGDFLKGALIGAGITFLLTNKTTQNAVFNGFAKASELFNVGIEEMKERIEDAKAQMEAKDL